MIKNIWEIISFYCMNHDEPLPMYGYSDTRGSFYACKKYMLKDDEHPDGHEADEPPCYNRVSFTTATDIVTRLTDIIQEDIMNGIEANYKNMRFKIRGIEVKILKYKSNEIRIGILNKTVYKG